MSISLSSEFGKGFSQRNLEQMRQFFLVFSKAQTVSAQSNTNGVINSQFILSWSHYLKLMRIDDENERKFYEIESYKNNWSLRELNRQYDTALYTRLALSKNKNEILKLSELGQVIEEPKDAIKDPYVLEFLGLPEKNIYSENELEQKLIDKLEHFLLELGTGFAFVARQKRISFDEKHFKNDLVFYNRILKCFVLIDLKVGELKHQDIGQMDMYRRMFDDLKKPEGDLPTIGIILFTEKSETVVKYSIINDSPHLFATKYLPYLPSEKELIDEIEREKIKLKLLGN